MPFHIVRQDITKMKVDVIVNAANTDLAMGGGVCGAIFKAAGAIQLQAACDKMSPIKTGEAVITPGFNLEAKFIIHAVGPVYRRFDAKQSEQYLRSAYTESLRIAVENKCESIAFPLISSGIYGYPKYEALKVATSVIWEFLAEHDLDISLAVFDKAAFELSEEILGEVEDYIEEHYIEENKIHRRILLDVEKQIIKIDEAMVHQEEGIDHLVNNLDKPFETILFELIDEKGKTDVEIYKRANLDRKLFSKIRTGKGYNPSKRTAVALAVALELNLEETGDLLERAGYTLSHTKKFDIIVEYFIIHGKYNVFEINEVLFQYDQPLLGS